MLKNMNLSFKKKANVMDIIFIVITLILLGLGFFFIKYAFDDINTDLIADTDLSEQAKSMISSGNANYTSWSDYAVGFVFFGLLMGILITSYLIDTHPVFFVVSLILFIFVIFVGVEISNSFQEIVGETEFLTLQDDYPITMFIINNLVMILIAIFVLMSIILYGKTYGNNSGGGSYQ